LAGLEGLDAHAAAVTIRLDALTRREAGGVMSPLHSLARPEILTLKPYSHAAWLPSLTRLHANEAPWRPAGDLTEAGLNRYPEPQPHALVRRLAALYDVSAETLLVSRGSDEAIDLLSRIYLRAGEDAILQCTPTFGMYQVAARIQGAAVIDVPLDRSRGWAWTWTPYSRRGPHASSWCTSARPTTPRATPSTPTLSRPFARRWTARPSWSSMRPTSNGRELPSLTPWLARFPTMAFLRTLSKAHALAGARVGALIAHPDLIQLAKRVIPPYCLAQSTIEATLRALQPDAVAASRKKLDGCWWSATTWRGACNLAVGRQVWPSDANFLLIDCHDAERFMQNSIAGGSIVRDLRSNPALPNSLRVSVGTRAQNDALLSSVGAA
jgi:histidinol-phosphate aminotransferase